MGRPGEEQAPQIQAYQQPQYVQPQQFPPPQNVAAPTWMPPPPAGSIPPPMPNIVTPTAIPNSQVWKTGLFDCADDPMNAVITFFYPCITFGQIAEILDDGQTSCETAGILYTLVSIFTGLPCIYSCTYRTKLRNRYGLVDSGAPDWLLHCFCDVCAMCQEYRELQHRGLDPSIGWLGNVTRNQQQQQQMSPPTNQRMMG